MCVGTWTGTILASRLAKSPRPDKKGSAGADSAEAGANEASLVDKVLEGSRGKGDIADVGTNKAPWGVRAWDTVSEPEDSRGKDDMLMSVQTRLSWGLELGTQ